MGNYRFKLSNMMPNAWFYKLKDMGKNRHHYLSGHTNNKNHPPSAPSSKHQPLLSLHNHSNCYHTSSDYYRPDRTHKFNPKTSDTHFPDPPRKSKKQANRRSSKLVSSSVSAGCSCRATFKTVWKPDCSPTSLERNMSVRANASPTSNAISDPFDGIASWSSSSSSRVSSSASDIIIDVNSKDPFFQKFDGFDPISELELPPILTEPARIEKDAESVKFAESNVELQEKNADGPHSVEAVKERSSKTVKEERRTGPARRSSSPAFQGLKIHANSPRMASEKMGAHNRKVKSTKTKQRTQRKSATESFAVMKSSFDPQRDFRESMMEMIVENNIRAPKDLEDLLACYLSLNSSEYHDVIVKVFEQIWFDLTNIHL